MNTSICVAIIESAIEGNFDNLEQVIINECLYHTERYEFDKANALLHETKSIINTIDDQLMVTIQDWKRKARSHVTNACVQVALDVDARVTELTRRIRSHRRSYDEQTH